jgi:hypothetical protein
MQAKHLKLYIQVAILAVFYTLETTCVYPNLCILRQPNGSVANNMPIIFIYCFIPINMQNILLRNNNT